MAQKKIAKKSTAKAAKKPLKKVVKKAAKKTVSVKASSKSSAKKQIPAKKAKPSKKVAVKAAPKKAAAPKSKAPAKKAVKSVKPATKAPVAKTVAKVTAVAKPTKKLDLSHFVTPLDDRLIVQVLQGPKMTAGGLYIPDTVSDVSGNREALVVAVGRGHLSKKGRVHPMDVQVGDKVLFAEHAGSKIQIQNEDLIILRESEVMGVVSK